MESFVIWSRAIKPKQPLQPLQRDPDGVARFKRNAIVRYLLDWATPRGMSLNELAMMDFSQEDREQFAQLIGYSTGGFSELSYARRKTIKLVEQAERELMAKRGSVKS